MNEHSINDFRVYSEASLCHHQVKGAKWGVRHGPPYPLDKETHDRIVKSKQYSESSSQGPEHKRKKDIITRTDYEEHHDYNLLYFGKYYVDKAMAAVGDRRFTGFYAEDYDSYREWQAVEERVLPSGDTVHVNVAKAISEDDSAYRKPAYELSYKNLDKILNDATKVNPGYVTSKYVEEGAFDNCPMCTTAFELRMRGYDVSAARTEDGAYSSFSKYWFDNVKFEEDVPKEEFHKMLKSAKPGSHGSICFQYYEKDGGGAHVMNWIKTTDKRTLFIDSQSAFEEKGKYYTNLNDVIHEYAVDSSMNFGVTDYTDATPNFSHMAKDSVITSNQLETRVKYRNKYTHDIIDSY